MSAECSAGNIPPGYKQTEVGVIPEDWDTRPCSTLSELITVGIVIRPTQYYVKHGVPALRSANIREKGIDDVDMVFISEKANALLSKSQVRTGDVLTVRTGYPGTSAVVPPGFSGSNCIDILITRPSKAVSPTFLSAWINSPIGKSQVLRNQGGLAQQHFNVSDLRNLVVALPPTKAEQEAIAEALSDADAFIESMEQLIAKKRQIKKGTMQELLLPKGGWEPTSLGNIADPNQRWSFTGGPFGSNLKSSDYTTDGIRIIQLQNIGDGEFKDNYEVYTSTQKADELLSCNIYPGEIILSKMGDPVARACIIPPHKKRYLMCSDGIRLAIDQKRFNTYFVYTLINAPEFRTKAANAGTGSTRKRIGLTELRNLELLCPSLSEQKAIATILSDMDSEITALEEKLAKTRQIKQGMMQELLTGRIRLI